MRWFASVLFGSSANALNRGARCKNQARIVGVQDGNEGPCSLMPYWKPKAMVSNWLSTNERKAKSSNVRLLLRLAILCLGVSTALVRSSDGQELARDDSRVTEELRALGAVTRLDDDGCVAYVRIPPQTIDAVLDRVKGLARIQGLNFAGARLRRDHIDIVAALPVTALYFDDTNLSNAMLEGLKRLPNVTALGLSRTQIDDAGLDHLSRWPAMQVLYLSGTRVSDVGLAKLRSLRNLQWLTLDGCYISDDGVSSFAEMHELELLHVNGTVVADAGVSRLGGLKNLRDLQIIGTGVSDATIERLRGANSRLRVTPSSMKASADERAAVVALARSGARFRVNDAGRVSELQLRGKHITDTTMKHVSALVDLEIVKLAHTSVSSRGLSSLDQLRKIRHVDLWYSPIDGEAFARSKAFGQLSIFRLYGTETSPASAQRIEKQLSSARQDAVFDFNRGAFAGVELETDASSCTVRSIVPGGAAFRAGLQAGDLIQKCDEKPVPDVQAFKLAVSDRDPGEEVTLSIIRSGEQLLQRLRLEEWPSHLIE